MSSLNKIKKFNNWENKGIALITGASSGIGATFAKYLAQLNFNLIFVARRKEKMEKISEELKKQNPISVEILPADLATEEGIAKVEKRIKELNNLDILINNAGFGTIGSFLEADFAQEINMHSVHVIAPYRLTRAALPIMLQRKRGVIINVSSLASYVYLPGSVSYSATKSYLRAFSETLAIELEDTGVKIQALCPGFTHTEFHSVGDFENFDQSQIVDGLWMSVDDVVKESLNALDKSKTVVIPGFKNRFAKALYELPLIGRITKKILLQKLNKSN